MLTNIQNENTSQLSWNCRISLVSAERLYISSSWLDGTQTSDLEIVTSCGGMELFYISLLHDSKTLFTFENILHDLFYAGLVKFTPLMEYKLPTKMCFIALVMYDTSLNFFYYYYDRQDLVLSARMSLKRSINDSKQAYKRNIEKHF